MALVIRSRRALAAMLLVSLGIVLSSSCTTILGIDTGYQPNPCVDDADAGVQFQTCGRGACLTIAPVCENGLPVACADLDTSAKSDEMCDGIDNNCNGAIDEGCACMEGQAQPCYPGALATRNIGLCQDGQQQCVAGQWGDCKAPVMPLIEKCGNGRDDDCNGKIDDGCACTLGQKQNCYAYAESTLGTSGPCTQGTQTCQADGTWGACADQIPPTLEQCNGVDDDCDGAIDDHITCMCHVNSDCPSGLCKIGQCAPLPSCTDQVKNGTEADVDCGGPTCAKCEDYKTCLVGSDCKSGVCNGSFCVAPICADQVKNASEADVDCGGPTCPKCDPYKTCANGSDCKSGICNSGTQTCAPASCSDGLKNGTETDIDCGGPTCPDCPDASHCVLPEDCKSAACQGNICVVPTCVDGLKNSTETDVDCGGAGCEKCPDAKACVVPQDCKSSVCKGDACQSAICNDGVKNGTETDVDCGGPACPLCPIGKACSAPTDCQTGVCNGVCGPKINGQTCASGADCSSSFCVDSVCCDTACAGSCRACSAAKKGAGVDGACANIAVATDPDSECGTDPQSTCGKTGLCDGAGACQIYASSSVCQPAACVTATTLTLPHSCDGGGQCIDNGAKDCSPYACGSGACKASCTLDVDCSPTAYCLGTACVQKKPIASTCSAGNECTSGNCVDGVCCGSTCNGICLACNISGHVGTCSDTPAAQQDAPGCAGANVCNGSGSCLIGAGTPCLQNAHCATGFCVDGYCCNNACAGTCQACNIPGSAGTCTSTPLFQQDAPGCVGTNACAGNGACLLANSAACTADSQCAGGSCVDGVCCNSACNGTCQACNVPGSLGICTFSPALQPDSGTCAGGSVCNGAGLCLFDHGAPCGQNSQCAAGVCVDGVCCSSACNGTCQACNIAGSVGTCTNTLSFQQDPGTCGGSSVCNGSGACLLNNGILCAQGSQCTSGSCVDGVCCNSSCNGTCQTCNLPGSVGTCANMPLNQQDSPSCTGTSVCNGAGACLLGNGVGCTQNSQCVNGFCADGVCCDSACTGECRACSAVKKGSGADGACGPVAPGNDPDKDCLPYVCGASSCLPKCTADVDCAGGNYCLMTACVAKKSSGAVCSAATECQSQSCVDGVCCNTSCGGTCQACNIAGSVGTCANTPSGQLDSPGCTAPGACNGAGACLQGNSIACAQSSQCASGICVDGVCCSNACNGTCQACNVTGSVGTCTNTPSGQLDAPACGGNNVCNGSGTCLAGNGVACSQHSQCASGSCADGVCCNNACSGTCQACNVAGSVGACTSTPANQQDAPTCGGNNVCNGAGACLVGNGIACSLGAQCASGSCVDGVCCNTACNGTCQACNVPGSLGACTSTPTNQQDAPGCTGSNVCNGAGACLEGNGVACSQSNQCASGGCVDGVCCNSACSGTCQSCNVAGSAGTCTNTPPSQQDAPTCVGNSACTGSGACLSTLGTACSQSSQCLSGQCVDGVCCNTACQGACQACTALLTSTGVDGTCSAIAVDTDPKAGCGAYTCNGSGSCLASCGKDADCTSGKYCSSGACVPRKALGQTCGTATECTSSNCVDGSCCSTSSCSGCKACNLNAAGTCSNLPVDTDPKASCGNFTCNGAGACFATCGKDADCSATSYCGAGGCVVRRALGQSCAAGNECSSGNCVDGSCCSTSSCGACKACSLNGAGTCSSVPVDTDPKSSCGAYTCGAAGACFASCTQDADCSASNYCSLVGACVPRKALGQACGAGNECSSSNCVDGSCCSTSSCGACKACNLTPAGTCTSIPVDTDPKATCGAYTCSGAGACFATCSKDADCAAGNYCGAGACVPMKALGQTCGAGNECSSSNCVDGSCCSTSSCGACKACNLTPAGTCTSIPVDTDPKATCGAYTCSGAGACFATCSKDADCAAGNYCGAGLCVARKALGLGCGAGNECAGGTCADSVCCNVACSGTCAACNLPGSLGACSSVPVGQPDDTCATPGQACDGAGLCKADNGSACAAPSECLSNVCVLALCQPCAQSSDCTSGQTCAASGYCQ